MGRLNKIFLTIISFGLLITYSPKTIFGAEQYYMTKIKNSKIGYSYIASEEKQDQDKKFFVTKKHDEYKFNRLGFTIKILQDSNFVEDENGNPVSFSSKTESLGENTLIEGKFLSSNRVLVNSTINGTTKSEEVKLDKQVLFPYSIEKLFKDNPDKDIITYSTVDPSIGFRVITITAKKAGTETLANDGLDETFNKYQVTASILPNSDNYEWHDKDGKLIKEFSSILNIEQIASSKDKIFAVANNNVNYDLFTQALIPVDTDITDISILDQVNYKIEVQDINPNKIFESDDRQRIIQTKDNIIYLKIKNELSKDERFKYPVTTKGYSEYLKSGPFIISDNKDIKKQVDIITDKETDAYKISKKMEKWVYDNVTNKNFSVNFANSTQVLKSRQGDCTEHSVLLAALLRAAGIPSKVVVGLMYTDNPEKSFGYHMWVKAYVGKWISLDPSFPDDNFSPVHIAVADSSLNNLSDKTNIMINIMKSFSKFKINILNYTTLTNNPNIINVKFTQSLTNLQDNKFNLLSFLKTGEGLVNNISLKKGTTDPIVQINLNEKTIDDFVASGFYSFSQGDILSAKENFKNAAKLISYDDDFANLKLSVKLASLGLFNLANDQLKDIHDSDIWKLQIQNIKTLYYPVKILDDNEELTLAESLSKIKFQKNPDKAISLIKSLKDSEKSDYAHFLLAKAYLDKKQTKNALDEFNKAIEINSNNLSYRLELAKAYSLKKDFNKAETQLNFILNQNITDKDFIKLVNSELFLLKSNQEKKNADKSQYYLAKHYYAKDELGIAQSILKELSNKKCNKYYLYELSGDIYFSLKQYDQAQISYKLALKYNKKSLPARLGLGNIALNRSEIKNSLREYLKAEKINPDSIGALLAIANNYKLLSQEEISYYYYNKVLKLDKNNCTANYNIGMMYLNKQENEKAENYFKKALAADPDSMESWLELAKIQINKKNNYLAKMYLDPVGYLGQQNPNYYYYLGLINKNSENYSSARSNFNKAIELNPDYSEAKEELKNL